MVLAEKAHLSFSAALGSRRKAVSRILHHKDITQQDLLSSHIHATKERCLQEEMLLIASDTTSFDFTTHKATKGLGPIRKKAYEQGFFLHSALALNVRGTPLGVLYQQSWVRDKQLTGQSEQRRQRDFADKESHKWLDALRGVEQALPAYQKALLIQDREADVFEFFAAPRQDNIDLLLRAAQPRRIEVVAKDAPKNLFAAIEQAPVIATKTLQVAA